MAELQTLFSSVPFVDALTTTSSFLLVVCEPKLTVGSSVCTGIAGAAKVTQIFKQKLEIQHGCPVSSQGLHLSPQPQENRCFPGILTPESCYSASSSAAKVDMSICPLATDSLYIKCGCVSLVSFLFHAGENTLG